jgi:hypothetical protein
VPHSLFDVQSNQTAAWQDTNIVVDEHRALVDRIKQIYERSVLGISITQRDGSISMVCPPFIVGDGQIHCCKHGQAGGVTIPLNEIISVTPLLL